MQDHQAPQAEWRFNPEDSKQTIQTQEAAEPSPSSEVVTWTASEYVAHEKNLGWYLLAGIGTLILAVVVYFAAGKSWFSALMMLIGGGVFIAAAARQPRVLTYLIDNQTLTIGSKAYKLNNFKSFSVIEEGPIQSILLAPLERFMPGLTIYYDPKDEEKITAALGDTLPYEAREAPLVDKLMRKIRF